MAAEVEALKAAFAEIVAAQKAQSDEMSALVALVKNSAGMNDLAGVQVIAGQMHDLAGEMSASAVAAAAAVAPAPAAPPPPPAPASTPVDPTA